MDMNLKMTPAEMESAELRMTQMAERCYDIATDLRSCCDELLASFEGETARSYDNYITTIAIPNMNKTADMNNETAGALQRTRQALLEADRAVSATFNVS